MEKQEIKIPSGCVVDSIATENGSLVVTFKAVKPQLPKTWEEFCENNNIQKGEYFIDGLCNISQSEQRRKREVDGDRNMLPDRATAEAVLALCQLIQLRDCYNQGWVPNWNNYDEDKYIIAFKEGETFKMNPFFSISYSPLYFKTEELRDLFFENFRDLIMKLKPLYGIKEDVI